ncbi:MAG: hypothetical protein II200_08235 [Bacteroidaceae bacterium]|nr:hypothetical protein [Bacteroidaceae bacterium]
MKNYESPAVRVIELHTEGMLAASSDYIPVNPNKPGTSATKEMDKGWNSAAWE